MIYYVSKSFLVFHHCIFKKEGFIGIIYDKPFVPDIHLGCIKHRKGSLLLVYALIKLDKMSGSGCCAIIKRRGVGSVSCPERNR